jgi:Ran GTPase-activating protein (RanGAP) involved in mRNA processing and transport
MSVCAEARAFVAGAEELFRLAPVRHVQLYWGTEPPHERARFMQAVAAVRQLSRLQTLDLSDGFIGSDGVQALAVCEYLDSLESLDLRGGHIGERGVRALVEASWFANLLSLDLRNNDVNAAAVHALASGLAALARAGRLRLRKLVLEGNPLRQSGMRVIRASPELRRVAQL